MRSAPGLHPARSSESRARSGKKTSTPPTARFAPASSTFCLISEIEEGDLVAANDPETGETYAEPVVDVIIGLGDKHLVQLSVDGAGEFVTATANHPVWVDGKRTQTSPRRRCVGRFPTGKAHDETDGSNS